MKSRVLLALIAVIASTFVASAQNFRIDWVMSDTVTADPSAGLIYHHATLVNTAGKTVNMAFDFTIKYQKPGHTLGMCYGPTCYGLEGRVGSDFDPYEMPAGGTEDLKVQLSTGGVKGYTAITIDMYNYDNPTERVAYTVYFNAVTSVSDMPIAGLRVGPTPTTGSVTLTGDALESLQGPSLYDASGNIRRSYSHDGGKSLTIDTEGLASGVYYLLMHNSEGKLFKQSIVVTR